MDLADQVVSRHLEAAKLLAKLPSDKPDALCARALAAQQLLLRQARALVALHAAWSAGESTQPADQDRDLVRSRLDDLAATCTSAFYSYRFDRLPYHWRQIYTDVLILSSHLAVLQGGPPGQALRDERAIDAIVEKLDRALITAGGAGKLLGKRWIEATLALLERLWRARDSPPAGMMPAAFPADEPHGRPRLSEAHACPRHRGWGLAELEAYMFAAGSSSGPRPLVFTDLMDAWPALGARPWNSPGYLLSQTLGGKRLVPVELGRSYVDAGWGQQLVPFGAFLQRHVLLGGGDDDRTGYLAQHDLFRQIPALRRDVLVPDLCWASVPGHPLGRGRDQPRLEAPQLNAWFGPARTITPLHTDGYHNLLCQAVGTKYVRLYPPGAGARLRPRGAEHGVDMSNTSGLDVGVLEGWDEDAGEDDAGEGLDALRAELRGVEYWECVLAPGDALLIPIGWWHYVRSLSTSFSVSFWWN